MFLLFHDKVRPFVEKMEIDEARKYVLTNYHPVFKLQYDQNRQERVEILNFKDAECQESIGSSSTG